MTILRDFDLNEWRTLSRIEQEMAALAAGQELRQLDENYDKACDRLDDLNDKHDVAINRVDLLHRRTEIALAILRDDEAGLTYNQLNQLADVIWPKSYDPTQEPTPPKSAVENEMAQLLHTAVVSFRELMKMVPVGSTSREIECENCEYKWTIYVAAPFELGGLRRQIDSFQLSAKELLNKLYGRLYD